MRTVRDELELEQGTMASRLGISQRLLSNWENAYTLPSARERLQFLYTMNELHPEWVDRFVTVLGLRDHPGIAPLYPEEEVLPVAPPPVVVAPVPIVPAPPPAPPVPTPEQLRALLDSAVREAADVVDVRASDLRRGVQAVLGAIVGTGASIDDAHAVLSAKAKESGGAKGGG